MKVRRKRYSKEFKQEALRRLQQGDKSVTELSMELGLRRNLLYLWQEEAQKEEATRSGPGKPDDKDARIARLEKELEAAKLERDILKKAAAYFARDLK
jgi:transposase